MLTRFRIAMVLVFILGVIATPTNQPIKGVVFLLVASVVYASITALIKVKNVSFNLPDWVGGFLVASFIPFILAARLFAFIQSVAEVSDGLLIVFISVVILVYSFIYPEKVVLHVPEDEQ